MKYSYLIKNLTALRRFKAACERKGWTTARYAVAHDDADYFSVQIGDCWRAESKELPSMLLWDDIEIFEIK